MFVYPKPIDTVGENLERLVTMAKTHGHKLDLAANTVTQA
jgi:hypothetical protein